MKENLGIIRALRQRGLRKVRSLKRLGLTEEQARAILDGGSIEPEVVEPIEEVKAPVKKKTKKKGLFGRKKKD